MSLRRLSANAAAATTQTVIVTAVMVGLYSIMVRELGVERVGIWSLVMSVVAIGKIGEAGLGTTLMRFTAQDLGHEAYDRLRPTLLSCALIVMAGTMVLALAAWPALQWLLTRLITDPDHLAQASALLPYALTVMILTALANVMFGLIDAFQRTYLRAIAVSVAAVFQLTAAIWLIPAYGLMGVAYVQVSQTAVMLVFGLGIVAWLLARTPGRWGLLSGSRLGELLRFGAGLQLNTLGQLFFEPCAKALVTAFGGLTMTGYYEVANRAVVQLRSLVVTAFQMLVPYVAGRFPTAHQAPAEVLNPYRRSLLLMQAIVCVGLPVLLAVFPVLFALWVQRVDTALLIMAVLCAFGWGANMLTVPAYLFALALGKVRWTVESHAIIGLLTPLLAGIGGWLAGGPGVAAGAMLALVAGSTSATLRMAGALNAPVWPMFSAGLWALALLNLLALGLWSLPGAQGLATLLNWPALQQPLFEHAGLPLASYLAVPLVMVIAGLGWLFLVRSQRLWQQINPTRYSAPQTASTRP